MPQVLTWNIDKGFHYKTIIEELQRQNADIILLQEVDIQYGATSELKLDQCLFLVFCHSCKRTNSVNIFAEIAYTLQMNGMFVCEFRELESPSRQPEMQGSCV